jgi:hypothetical protein
LGLNIARELVSLNLGEMRAQSEVGVGSTFSFVVPVDDPIEVTERFLAKRKRAGGEFMSLVTGTIDPGAPVDQAAEVLAFLNHLVRGNELSFQGVRGKWILLLPEPESEAIQFISRANQELDAANRNRPKGAMANVTFNIDAAWSDLSCNAEEIIGRISTHLREGEEVYV